MLSSKAILMRLTLPSFEFSRTDRAITADVLRQHGADSKSGRFVKVLLPKEITRPVSRLLDDVRDYHRTHTLPWGDDGTRLLPSAKVFEYTGRMREFSGRLESAATAFEAAYDDHLGEAQKRLNGMFNPGDYPAKGQVKARLRLNLEPSPVPDGRDFRVTIGTVEMREMQESIAARVAEAEREARNDLLTRLATPLAAMVNRLNDPDAIFRDTLVTNLHEIAALIPALNITEDSDIEAARLRVISELGTYRPDDLRESPTLRNDAAVKAQSILDQMSAFMMA